MRKSFMLLIFSLFIGVTGIAQESTLNAKETIKENSRIMETAMKEGDFETFGSYFTEDALFKISNHDPLNGRAAITEAHTQMKGINFP